jgi:hypothetical protein
MCWEPDVQRTFCDAIGQLRLVVAESVFGDLIRSKKWLRRSIDIIIARLLAKGVPKLVGVG